MNPESSGRSTSSLWTLTRGYRVRYIAAMVAMAGGVVFLLLVPAVLKRGLDELTQTDTGSMRTLLPVAGMIVLLTALHGVFTFLRGKWSAQASEGITRTLRNRLYGHLEALPIEYFDKHDTGDLVQRCSSDVETVRVFLSSQVVEIANVTLLLLVGLPIMFWQDVWMSLISICLFPVLILFGLFYYGKIRAIFEKVEAAEGELTTVLQENLTGIRVVRAFAQQDREIAKFREANSKFRELEVEMFHILSIYWSLSDLVIMLQIGLSLIGGAYFAMTGAITIGGWIFFWWLTKTIVWPVRHFGRVVADAGRAAVAMKRINNILGEAEESVEPIPEGPVEGKIEIHDLSFAYEASHDVLKNLTLTIDQGETIAIIGPPGAGKSTLIQLLIRLYDYERGAITIGGRELRDTNRRAVRDSFGVVMQDPFLYSRSIQKNVVVGRKCAAQHEVEEATRAADIHGNIENFDHGYDTLIGERGVTLSGGQRQRLAIARALLKNPAFLVLDDSLSAVDTRTETQILKSLAARRGKQTTILIAHRLSTTRLADRIVVLDRGQLLQLGTHDELMKQDGPYRRLWTIQGTVEDEIEGALAEGVRS